MKTIYLVASGDLRLSANQNCEACAGRHGTPDRCGRRIRSAERSSEHTPTSKRRSMDSSTARSTAWRCSAPSRRMRPSSSLKPSGNTRNHVLPGLLTHRGPILTVANWSGTWPGLVGMLNLNASLTKAGVPYSTLWSEDFTDPFFMNGLATLDEEGQASSTTPRTSCPYKKAKLPAAAEATGSEICQGVPHAESDHGDLRRRMHGDVQRHHSRRTPARDRRSSRSG